MTSFATYDDLCARTDIEVSEEKAEALLGDAAAMLMKLLGRRYDPSDGLQAANLRAVSCNMVIRALSASNSGAGYGVTQWSQTASSFNEQFSYANPTGDLYLTSAEKKMLGIGSSQIFTVEPTIRPNFGMRPKGGDD